MRGYEVFETELAAIAEAGNKASIFFSAGLGLVTLGLSLFFGEFESLPGVLLALVGVGILYLGWRERTTASNLIQGIRDSADGR